MLFFVVHDGNMNIFGFGLLLFFTSSEILSFFISDFTFKNIKG